MTAVLKTAGCEPTGVRIPHPGRTVRPYKHRTPPASHSIPRVAGRLATRQSGGRCRRTPGGESAAAAQGPPREAGPTGPAAAVRRSPGGMKGRLSVPAGPRRALPRPPEPCRAIARHPNVPPTGGTASRRRIRRRHAMPPALLPRAIPIRAGGDRRQLTGRRPDAGERPQISGPRKALPAGGAGRRRIRRHLEGRPLASLAASPQGYCHATAPHVSVNPDVLEIGHHDTDE